MKKIIILIILGIYTVLLAGMMWNLISLNSQFKAVQTEMNQIGNLAVLNEHNICVIAGLAKLKGCTDGHY